MSRAPLAAAALAALGLALVGRPARAQNCESTRPTDPEGAAGLTYGSAEVGFFDSPSGRARVHYALTGPNAPPAESTMEADVPDAAVVAARAADDAFDKYAALDYQPPLGDGSSPCAENGGNDAIDVYLINFAAADGQAIPDHCESGTPRRCAGFVLVENDFASGGYADTAEGLRTVVPHELFHLVQDAYDANVERWWAEGSAQWAAKQVYPDLRDLERFLPAYFDSPWRPFNVPPSGVVTNFLYATAIWPVFLEQRFDASIVRQVYEAFDGTPNSVLPTTDQVLKKNGSSLPREYTEFAAFNAGTGARAPAHGGYANAAKYPEVKLKALDTAPGDLFSDVGSGLGSFYFSVSTASPLALSLDADPERVAAVAVPLVDGQADVAAAQALPVTLQGDAILVVAGQSLNRTDAPFKLRAATPDDGGGVSSACSLSGKPDTQGHVSGMCLTAVASAWAYRNGRRRRKGSG
jgi:hypothetical protein